MNIMLCGGTPKNISNQKNAEKYPFWTMPFDRMFLSWTGKSKPNILIIPTAMEYDNEYAKKCEIGVQLHFQKWLNCFVKVLHLSQYSYVDFVSLLSWADCLYITGGCPEVLLKKWKKYKLDKVIADQIRKGKPIMGISAGAMILFEKVFIGYGDDIKLSSTGLGILEGACFPHYNRDENKYIIQKFLQPKKSCQFLCLNDGDFVAITNNTLKHYNIFTENGADTVALA